MKRLVAIAMLVAACGGGSASTEPDGETISGTVVLSNGEAPERTAGACTGTGGYDDMHVGAQVVVTDAAGDIVATGRLTLDPNGPEPAGSGAYQCGYAFSIAGVPASDFYSVGIAGRKGLTYSATELESMGWDLDLSLGD